jgi:hypothetical protein
VGPRHRRSCPRAIGGASLRFVRTIFSVRTDLRLHVPFDPALLLRALKREVSPNPLLQLALVSWGGVLLPL